MFKCFWLGGNLNLNFKVMKDKTLEPWSSSLGAHWDHLGKVLKIRFGPIYADPNSIGLEWREH